MEDNSTTLLLDGAMELQFDPEGGMRRFPVAGEDARRWAAARFLVLDVTHEQDEVLALSLGFYDDAGAAEPRLATIAGVLPGVPTRIAFPLQALDSQRVFLPRTPGKLKTLVAGEPIAPSRIAEFGIGTLPSANGWRFTVTDVRLTDSEPDYPVPPVKLADELGQYTRKSWPGKTADPAELAAYLQRERSKPAAPADPARSRYGGWKAKTFAATGYFRTERDGRRWWLVDPDGCAFYSLGMDCVNSGETMKVDGMEPLLGWLPEEDGAYAEAWSTVAGRGELQDGRYFNYAVANLIRAFGQSWYGEWTELTRRRLLEWGFNTVGNWSDPVFIRAAGLPYVLPLERFPATSRWIFRDFPDVFSDEFRRESEAFASQLHAYADDRNLIGYFLRNEPLWAFAGDVNLAAKLLEQDASFESKRELIRFLSERHDGDIGRLNAAWGTGFASFDSLLQPVATGELLQSAAAAADLDAFTGRMIEAYNMIPSLACRKADPNHLNLGMRYAWVASPKLYRGCEHFDVFSINCYKMKPDADEIREIAAETGLPVMIGEYHFGAPDAGLLATGLRGVTTQEERGKAYSYYVEHAAALSDLVGVHYFILNDQALLGRFDGENFQIGAVDVCHRPYEPFIGRVKQTHARVYEIADGTLEPTGEQAKEIPRVGF